MKITIVSVKVASVLLLVITTSAWTTVSKSDHRSALTSTEAVPNTVQSQDVPPALVRELEVINSLVQDVLPLIEGGHYTNARYILEDAVKVHKGQPARRLRELLAEVEIRDGRFVQAFGLLNADTSWRGGLPVRTDDGHRYARLGYLKLKLGDFEVSKLIWDDMATWHNTVKPNDWFDGNWPDVRIAIGLEMAWLLLLTEMSLGDAIAVAHFLDTAEPHARGNPMYENYRAGQAIEIKDYKLAAKHLEAMRQTAKGRFLQFAIDKLKQIESIRESAGKGQ